jgi:hypothetical protein
VAGDGYRERLWPGWGACAFVLVVAVGLGIVVAPFGVPVMLVVAVVMTLVLEGLLLASAAAVGVERGCFVAGRARIPVEFLGPPEVLDATDMRYARGPGLDARAYLCLRGWIGPGLRIPVTDPEDPVPYWLVSSRRPQRLADALTRARA